MKRGLFMKPLRALLLVVVVAPSVVVDAFSFCVFSS